MFSSRGIDYNASPELDFPDASTDESDVEDTGDFYHLLSNNIRQEYLRYLEKILYTNYETSMMCNSHDIELKIEDLHACAKILELKALKSCMIVSLYRKAMLKIISDIRRETQIQQLSSGLMWCHTKVNTKQRHVETQTEPQNFLIERYFHEATIPESLPHSPLRKKRKSSKKRRSNSKTKEPPANAQKDEVEANLEKLFATETNELDIFETTYDPKMVLPETKAEEKSPKMCLPVENVHESLRDSMWPCELRMRRKKLYEIMCTVGDGGLRRYEHVRQIFSDLFGEESDEENVPPSPSTDMDAITLGSCRKRIAPIIVKHLMKPFNEGLISNRWLFKKLAKNLADSIVIENDYADDRYVRDFIDEYFAVHPHVADVTDIV